MRGFPGSWDSPARQKGAVTLALFPRSFGFPAVCGWGKPCHVFRCAHVQQREVMCASCCPWPVKSGSLSSVAFLFPWQGFLPASFHFSCLCIVVFCSLFLFSFPRLAAAGSSCAFGSVTFAAFPWNRAGSSFPDITSDHAPLTQSPGFAALLFPDLG